MVVRKGVLRVEVATSLVLVGTDCRNLVVIVTGNVVADSVLVTVIEARRSKTPSFAEEKPDVGGAGFDALRSSSLLLCIRIYPNKDLDGAREDKRGRRYRSRQWGKQ